MSIGRTKRLVTGRLRRLVYRLWFGRFKHLGDGAWISLRTQIECPESVIIGENTQIGPYCRISASGGHVHIGSNCYILPFTTILAAGGHVEIGDRASFNGYHYITGQGGLTIGDDAMFAPMVSIVANQHTFDDLQRPISQQPERSAGITIGNGGWVGVGVSVLDGVTIGDNVVIGANAVVTKDLPSYCVAAGVPAKILKRMDESET